MAHAINGILIAMAGSDGENSLLWASKDTALLVTPNTLCSCHPCLLPCRQFQAGPSRFHQLGHTFALSFVFLIM